ncbi:MAG: 23S rRNA (adenine(2503)-C(2))-methyltransferase RlmN [Acidobacteriota bacterium]|nr:23S rRNA (adenine(2503)-C(2))-methyltransferase RlmN [Acidobacteriota bacterium]
MLHPNPSPWDAPAPEKAGRPSAFGLLPEELRELGCPNDAEFLFSLLQRPWTWENGAPKLGKENRAFLEAVADLGLPKIEDTIESSDGSRKLALALSDGRHIETVHMPRAVKNARVTMCISSQVGCAMGCTFCATGAMGIQRNLSAGEIVGQVLSVMGALGPATSSQLTLVFMGMGEPLHNLEHVHRAIRVLARPQGLCIPARRITVSTCGLVSGIEKLAELKPRPLLAISLNASNDAARSRTMPVNRAWNLARLRSALDAWGPRSNEKFTFEYVLLAGENDTDKDADQLANWLGELRKRHNLNLIPMNEHGASEFHEPAESRIQEFSDRLKSRGCFVTVRRSRGRDVKAACGQLVK